MRARQADKKNQEGRSMVEILGVIGIMALMSISFVGLQTWVMNTIRADGTYERVMKRAWHVSEKILLRQVADLGDFDTDDGVYRIDTLALGANSFSMVAHDVSTAVCEKLRDRQWPEATVTSESNCTTKGDVVFTFSNGMESRAVCGNFVASACALSCDAATGDIVYADAGTSCGNSEHHGCDGYGNCVYTSQCGFGQFASSDDSCHECGSAEGETSTDDECNACANREWIGGVCMPKCTKNEFRDSVTKACHSCNYADAAPSSQTQCEKCNNRYWKNGQCYPHCGEGFFQNSSGTCISCNVGSAEDAVENECNYCPNRYFIGGKCYPGCTEYQMRDIKTGACVECATAESAFTSESDCDACGRYYDSNTQICYAACNQAETFHSSRGQCVSCSAGEVVYSTELECEKCDQYEVAGKTNRYYYEGKCFPRCNATGEFRADSGTCYDCSTNSSPASSQAECNKCSENRTWDAETRLCALNSVDYVGPCGETGFLGTDGSCYSCGELNKHPALENECNVCNGSGSSNRRKMVGGNCALETCPSGYFQGNEGACISCGSTLPFAASSTECAKCDSSETPRTIDGNNKCSLQDSTCSSGFISEQVCYPCDADVTVKANATERSKCTNR